MLSPHLPSGLRQVRATRSDEKLEAARPKVEELYNKEGARSPSQRDEVQHSSSTLFTATTTISRHLHLGRFVAASRLECSRRLRLSSCTPSKRRSMRSSSPRTRRTRSR